MAVKSYALTTRQRLIDFMGLSSSSLSTTQQNVLDRIIDVVTEYIENVVGRRIKKATYTNEVYDGDGSEVLQLKNYPVVSVSSVEVRASSENEDSWDSIDSKDYYVNLDSGIIEGMGGYKFVKGRKMYRVTYIAGYDFDNVNTFLSDTEGGDLEYAAWKLAGSAYNQRKSSQNVVSESLGDYSVSFRKTQMEDEEVGSILEKYGSIDVSGGLTPVNS